MALAARVAATDKAVGPGTLLEINHISFLCANVEATKTFYKDILGFREAVRPQFEFEGCWCDLQCFAQSCSRCG
jgi:catechol-2,3-dioxygenase